MKKRVFLVAVGALVAVAGFQSLGSGAERAGALALSGQVSSAEEGAMEGVLVSARKAGSTITVTVVSDKQGRYSFPAARLEPGKYALKVRAAGYDLEGPSEVSVARKPAEMNLRLKKA